MSNGIMELPWTKSVKIKKKDVQFWRPRTDKVIQVIHITPELGERIMAEFNNHNRSTSIRRVDNMALRMLDGTGVSWVFTHQGLAFDTREQLLDGQHRIQGVISSGVGQDFIVSFGFPPPTFKHIDTEGVRSAKNIFETENPDAKSANHLVSMARSMLIGMGPQTKISQDKMAVANFAIWYVNLLTDVYESLKKMPAWMKTGPLLGAFANAIRGHDRWPGGHGGRDPRTVLAMGERFANQNWRENNDPLKMLNIRLSNMRNIDKKSASSESERKDIYRLAVAAIRSELRGREISKLQISDTEWGAPSDTGKKPRDIPWTGPVEEEEG